MSGKVPNRQHTVKSREAFSRLVVDVFRLNGMLSAAGDALAAPAGQTSARWRVLAAVEEAPKTVAQIARDWSLARQRVQRIADLLEREGLVAYEENQAHRRASLLRPTPEGRSALRSIQQAQRAWSTAVGDAVGARDLERASAVLARVMAAVESEGERAA